MTDIEGKWLYEMCPEYFNPKTIKNIETRKEFEKIERQVIISSILGLRRIKKKTWSINSRINIKIA